MTLAVATGPDGPLHPSPGRKVLLADDHTLVRSALKMLLETTLGYDVAEAGSADAAVEAITLDPPHIVLLDIGMPGRDGLWALEQIRALRPTLPVVMLSSSESEEHVSTALELGASGYVVKEASVSQIAESVETAVTGRGLYLHPIVARRMLARNQHNPCQLTDRESEVLALLVDGATNEDIATTLFVTEKTVKTHVSSIFRKLGVSNRTQAATKALRDRLVRR